ncbi:MAG: MalY/PatB family protein [Pikeienuella sp.]|uniref:MalY/PatB family protein n=1 Tax=Pikeienuella sp. TaxID=2831957 RepID=UPI00391D01E4
MPAFDFDRPIPRLGTHCAKWDSLAARFGAHAAGALPMWVADMEFAAPPAVTEALRAVVEHGVHGYYGDPSGYIAAIRGWMKRRHGWDVEPGWILTTAGIVNGVNLALQAYCRPGDGVILQQPIYHPFAPSVKANGCHVVGNLLVYEDGRYRMDLDALAKAVDAKTRMLILCSPHNPCGRVWTREELTAIAEFCLERGILIVSDEIHHDLVFDGPHTVLASLSTEIAARTVTFTSSSKTFNLAGGHTGNAIISDPELRRLFHRQMERCGMLTGNRFGYIMAEAAYAEGEEWLDALLAYLRANRDLVDRFAAERLKGVRSVKLDATYLAWLDFSGTGMTEAEIIRRFEREAKVICNHGSSFGPGGAGFMRLNFACPRPMLEEALGRIEAAFADLQ